MLQGEIVKAAPIVAVAAALGLGLGVSACSGDNDQDTTATTATQATSESVAPAAQQPTAEELNAVLMRATDASLPIEERVNTVQGGENVPELFDVMAQSQEESGANFQVVPPVLPGYTPDTVLATVSFTRPDSQPQLAEDVEFVFEDGVWKLSQVWACTLINNTLPPEQVPEMCKSSAPQPAAPAEEQPGEQPAEGYQQAPNL